MHFRGGNCGVHGLSEGVLEEARICLFKYAYVVRVELNIDDVLMVGACNGDYDGEPDFNRCVDGIKHDVCLGVCQRDDEVGQL